jgi:hypothetical protein
VTAFDFDGFFGRKHRKAAFRYIKCGRSTYFEFNFGYHSGMRPPHPRGLPPPPHANPGGVPHP